MTPPPTEARRLYDIAVRRLDGTESTLADYASRLMLIVNVASSCGLTPQYAGLQLLHERYTPRGLSVLGFPCNQFGGQEPGDSTEISSFCSTNYGVTFAMFAKIAVNGEDRHPLYDELTRVADNEGREGDVLWNFEKFLVSRQGEVMARFDPRVEPDDPRLIRVIEDGLA